MKKTRKLISQLTSKGVLVALAIPILFLLSTLYSSSYAAGAKLFLSPSSGTFYVGSYLSVEVLVDTGGDATNVYKAVLAYPSEKLEAVSVSSGGSICSLWITKNTTTFECGATTAYKGSAGRIGVITFAVKAEGTAAVSIAEGQVKKADGMGTEILSARGAASFDLQKLPANVPAISSSTHPDQNAWYQAKTVGLSWNSPEGTDGFSYLLSQKPDEIPDDTSEGTETSKTYEELGDGTWYFHLKAKTADGWSSTNHFRIQIDSQPPEEFEIIVHPPTERISRAPLLSFVTTDKLSGIDYYEISIDGSTWLTTTSPYRFDRIRGGTHEITVRAVDRAGNTTEASVTLDVIGVPSPTIISPTEGDSIPLFAPLSIKVTAAAPGTVDLLLNGQRFAALDNNVGSELEYFHKRMLSPRGHKLSAIFINADGIESEPAEVGFKVNPMLVYLLGALIPGYLFYPILLAILLGLALLARRQIRRWRKRRERGRSSGQTDE